MTVDERLPVVGDGNCNNVRHNLNLNLTKKNTNTHGHTDLPDLISLTISKIYLLIHNYLINFVPSPLYFSFLLSLSYLLHLLIACCIVQLSPDLP